MAQSAIEDKDFRAYIYIAYKKMASWEPVDIDRDGTGDAYDKWDDAFMSNLEMRNNKLREFNETLNESTDENTIEMTERTKNVFKRGTIELV